MEYEHGQHEQNDAITVTGGRPFELLELLQCKDGALFDMRVQPQEHAQPKILDVLEGNADSFLARVRWLQFTKYNARKLERLQRAGPVPSGYVPVQQLQRRLVERFRAWGQSVRHGGHERFPGQLDQILADLGPCPSVDEPDAACLWLAALLNPLPALGVAPEIRGHVLRGHDWPDRLEKIKLAFDTSCQVVKMRDFRAAGAVHDDDDEIDVCRVS